MNWRDVGRFKEAQIGHLFAYIEHVEAYRTPDHPHYEPESFKWFIAPDDEDKNYRRAMRDGAERSFGAAESAIKAALKELAIGLLMAVEAPPLVVATLFDWISRNGDASAKREVMVAIQAALIGTRDLASIVDGCPSNECQIRNQCTRGLCLRPFAMLHDRAKEQAENCEPPGVQTGADAQLMVATLFDWIAANVDGAGQSSAVSAIAEAFHWKSDTGEEVSR